MTAAANTNQANHANQNATSIDSRTFNVQSLTMKKIKPQDIPQMTRRGRESLVDSLPFWNQLVQDLRKGLSRAEAVEIDLKPVEIQGRKVDEAHLHAAIKHQLVKLGFDKKYSILARNNRKQLFIVDHETAAMQAS